MRTWTRNLTNTPAPKNGAAAFTASVLHEAWEPGNATRYDLFVMPAGPEPTARLYLIWINGPKTGRSMVLPEFEPDAFYVAEKLGCNETDAEAILGFCRAWNLWQPEAA